MPTPDVLASTIMDSVAALMNDVSKDVYSYSAQLPYLKISLKELRELCELNNIEITNEVSSVLSVPIGTVAIGFNTTPALPSDLVEIQRIWERNSGSDPFIPMEKKEFLPHYLDGQAINLFRMWTWTGNQIRVIGANAVVELKIDYIKELFTSFVDQNSTIGMINAESYLHYKTAALCAKYIGENETRAEELNALAELAKDRMLGIENKGKQEISTRHRPFRASFKSRGLY